MHLKQSKLSIKKKNHPKRMVNFIIVRKHAPTQAPLVPVLRSDTYKLQVCTDRNGLEPVTDQKYGRLTCLERCVILPISSYSDTPFFCHRQRECLSQLTAAYGRLTHGGIGERTVGGARENKKTILKGWFLCLAPQTGLEPVTPRLTAACSTD